jgi:hypothetical protein
LGHGRTYYFHFFLSTLNKKAMTGIMSKPSIILGRVGGGGDHFTFHFLGYVIFSAFMRRIMSLHWRGVSSSGSL